jgi:hypothetical protein
VPHARRFGFGLLPVLALLLVGRVLVPAAPRAVAGEAAGGPGRLWTGAFHVHTTRSDGSGTPAEVAAAAARAGLDFVVLTDHGDGTRAPSPPAYLSGVLVIDAVEISTSDGHYLAVGLPRTPYPLAGDGRDVAEDVRRLGGIGILAHPDSARPALAWHDPDTRGDGLEILNADSAWRDESTFQLLRRLLPYPWRPAAVLATTLHYPETLLQTLDAPTAGAPRLAMAGVDAHARIGLRPGDEPMESTRTLARLPGYTASFGTFGLAMSWPDDEAQTGDATADARAVLRALHARAMHVVVFALADAVPLTFEAHADGRVFRPGDQVAADGPVTLSVAMPRVDGARIALLRNGRPWRAQDAGPLLTTQVLPHDGPGVYRAEVWLPRGWQQPHLPWMWSQAIAVGVPGVAPAAGTAARAGEGTTLTGAWHAEHDGGSTAAIAPHEGGRVEVATALRDGTRVSQFAAAVMDWPAPAPEAHAISFTGTAARPMRVSVQVREPGEGDGRRWVRSVYLDTQPRAVRIGFDEMRPVTPARGAVPGDRLHALLFVVDTVNATPGDRHTFTIEHLRLH